MNCVLENLSNHGYIAVFLFVLAEQIGIPLPAGLILLGAGALVGLHRMNFGMVIAVAVAASLIADSIWFYLGRRRGATILALIYRVTPRCRISSSRMSSLLEKCGPLLLLFSKFVPGLGLLAPPITGASNLGLRYFLLLDAGGALAWASAYALTGCMLRARLDNLQISAERGSLVIVAVVLTLLSLGWGSIRLRSSRIWSKSRQSCSFLCAAFQGLFLMLSPAVPSRRTFQTRRSNQARNERLDGDFARGKSLCGDQALDEDDVKISVRDVGTSRVVDVDGEVDLGTSPELRRTLFEAFPAVGKLALNLAAIRYIDSSGIATLIEVLNRSHRLKKQFVLFGLSPAVQDVFRLTQVVRVFEVFQTEQEALGS
jgi:anti-anti-sigma factor